VKPTVRRRLHAAPKSQTGATISLILAKDEGINVDVTSKRVTVQLYSVTP
jgi:hypothetical protein